MCGDTVHRAECVFVGELDGAEPLRGRVRTSRGGGMRTSPAAENIVTSALAPVVSLHPQPLFARQIAARRASHDQATSSAQLTLYGDGSSPRVSSYSACRRVCGFRQCMSPCVLVPQRSVP